MSDGADRSDSDQPLRGSAEPRDRPAGKLPLERLEHEICQLAAHISAGTCRWLEMVAEFDRRKGWGSWGCRSCAEWIAWRCALNTRAAREHVRVARRLEELPRIHAAFARGHLSYSKVRALTRVATGESEAELIELAEHATASQLERIVRGLRHVANAEAAQMQENRHLSLWWEDNGSLSIHGNLPPEDGAKLKAALEAMHDALFEHAATPSGSAEPASDRAVRPECGSAEPRESRRTTNVDALVALADAALADSDTGVSQAGDPDDGPGPTGRRGPRPEIVIHVDADTLASDAPGRCRLEHGSALAAETARRLACDSSVVPIVEQDGSTLSVGRKTRRIPPALYRALRARDGTCRFPGCEHSRFGDAHHIVHWIHGGETSFDNLVWLCRRHHRLVHEGRFSVERARGGEGDGLFVFRDQLGLEVSPSPSPPGGRAAALARSLTQDHGSADGEVASTPASGSGERLDLHYAVRVLADRPWCEGRSA